MKRWISALLCGILGAGALTGCGGPGTDFDGTNQTAGDSDTLKVYTWGEYTGENLIENFEDRYDCHVIVEYFDSNEMMYTKLTAGDRYDVLIPSEYMVERLIREEYLQELDRDIITNVDALADDCRGLPYDPENRYSMPYFWGSVGIVYNKNNVSEADLEREGWEILRDPKYAGRLYLYDSERDSFMIALKALGYSMNTQDEAQIQEAYEWLCSLHRTMDPVYVTDEIIDNMINGVKDMGIVYSGDASYILSENPDMGFYMPKQGTNIWSDGMIIPKNAPNPELANLFINYVLEYDSSYDNTATVGYTSTNREVCDDVTAEGGLYEGIESYIPRSGYEKDEVFSDNEVLRKRLSELWIKVKAQ